MKKLASLFLVPTIVCALVGDGLGQEAAAAPERSWYGWKTLLADGLSYGVIVGAAAVDGPPFAILGLGSYLAAPAGIHFAHNQPGRAVASVVLRIALPLTGGMLGATLANCGKDEMFCALDATVLGFGMGMVAANIIDASVAWDTRTPAEPVPPPKTSPSTNHSRINFTSAGIAPTANGAQLVLGGRF